MSYVFAAVKSLFCREFVRRDDGRFAELLA